MKSCVQYQFLSLLLIAGMHPRVTAFSLNINMNNMNNMNINQQRRSSVFPPLKALPEEVEVCGGKDCRRAGGGAKLENLITTVSTHYTL